ncbi:MAG: 4-(cytidine 5'-diphospho)-2-C-methyl-D-erythritol kinase [Pseudomonadota bacterium]
MLECLARAKVNLALHVTGKAGNGYHILDSLVVFADIGDVLNFEWATRFELSVNGPFSKGLDAGRGNLISRAAALMGEPPVHITLEKNLPISSGIGGGSSDAAQTLLGLSKLCGLELPETNRVLTLGADVPVCMIAQSCRMQGIGEAVTPLTEIGPFHGVLVNPGLPVSTAEVFDGLTCAENIAIDCKRGFDVAALSAMRNDLQASALSACPEIASVLLILKEVNANLARMSGSGATCFGLFDSQIAAADAAEKITAAYPGWWVRDCVLG